MARQILEAQGIRIPVITTLHGTDITLVGKDPGFEPVVSFSINQSDGVTAVSADLARETLETFHISRHIEVIPNFIDLSRFKKQAREHFRLAICPAGEKLLVHTSNFRKVKRIGDVLQMFALLRKNVPSKLLLVGDGPERQKMEMLSRELQLEQDVRFLGKLDAVEELLSVCDLFVMPSEKESFGLAALEAMACEVPVIASNAGGLPELIIQGQNGFMSPVGDVKDMARNAAVILQSENLPVFKAAALRRAQEFDINRILPRYEAFYREVCFSSRPISA
jgi:N-acetyl-alpha-D-glucosaminyl L-malate synthase BshA